MNVLTATNLVEELRWRGLIHTATEGAEETLINEKVTAYIGFDPTADSLHVGHLLPIMVLVHLQRYGHTPIALAGGGTGMIGDPSGRTKERQLLTYEQIAYNVECIKRQLSAFLHFEGVENPAIMVNNADWLAKLNLIEFLRDTGKHFTVNYMLAKDSVKTRLESEEGISFTEFSYMLLQSYDFLRLYLEHGCTFQMGGSDQWGNITAGAELIRKVADGKAHALTVPLVTSTSGVKFGKTEAGAVWLDPARTSPFRFYQFWINTTDGDVIPYLKYFTLLSREEIAELERALATEPHRRAAQTRLAEEVTRAAWSSAREQGIDLGIEPAVGPLPVQVQPGLLKEALVNLLHNAVRYTPRGGHVTVRLQRDGGQARITVADDGPGIPADELHRAGERFFRGSTVKLPGSGLGLAIVRSIAGRHGGQLTLAPGPDGRGLEATITLPLAEEGIADADAAAGTGFP